MGAQLPARSPGGSKRLVECQIVPWIDWKALWPVSCSAVLGGGLIYPFAPFEQYANGKFGTLTVAREPHGPRRDFEKVLLNLGGWRLVANKSKYFGKIRIILVSRTRSSRHTDWIPDVVQNLATASVQLDFSGGLLALHHDT